MLQLEEERTSPTVIKVVGVGGGGMNAVNRMIHAELAGVQFMVINTDEQVLKKSEADEKIQIGNRTTRGMGAGGDPEMGQKAAQEDRDKILQKIKGADMVFITAGMGGGTGTGAAPIVAEVAKELGALTVGVVTMPFAMEGGRRMQYAQQGIEALKEKVDTLITIKNDSIFKVIDRNTSVDVAFRLVDDILLNAVKGISDLINTAGLVNVDFADVRSIMGETGDAIMGAGEGVGDNRITDAVNQAINNALLDDTSIEGATALLINVCGGEDMSITDWKEVSELITAQVDPDANIIIGLTLDDRLEDRIHVTVIATGFKKVVSKNRDVRSRYHQERMASGGGYPPASSSPQAQAKSWKNYAPGAGESIDEDPGPVVSIRKSISDWPEDSGNYNQGYSDSQRIIQRTSHEVNDLPYENSTEFDEQYDNFPPVSGGHRDLQQHKRHPSENQRPVRRVQNQQQQHNPYNSPPRDRNADNLDIPAFLRRKKDH